jgi:hypothetical protein
MKNYWKPAVVIGVLIIAAIIVIPRLSQQTPTSTGTGSDGSSMAVIDKALASGKPTLLLLRSET